MSKSDAPARLKFHAIVQCGRCGGVAAQWRFLYVRGAIGRVAAQNRVHLHLIPTKKRCLRNMGL